MLKLVQEAIAVAGRELRGRSALAFPLLLAFAAGCALETPAHDREQILEVIAAQEAAWNRGDLDGFLSGYEPSDRVVFAGGDKVHRGFEALVRRYREGYPTREKMGRLTFSDISFERLEAAFAVVTGSWRLELGADERKRGVFTLIWRRSADGWKIVHDHTSRAD